MRLDIAVVDEENGARLMAGWHVIMANSMREYIDTVKSDPRFDTVFINTTMPDGFAITYKRAE